uniref:Lcl C-terminal domain-containing protein n=1 Tax=viral metagenome TaxID=1070528 RepID=A0A6M3LBB6_9ZZZZ
MSDQISETCENCDAYDEGAGRCDAHNERRAPYDHCETWRPPQQAASLEWHQDTVGPMTWGEAAAYAESLGEGWRLPTKDDLSAAHAEKIGGFKPRIYWSSSSYAGDSSGACYVSFSGGLVDYDGKSGTYYVRCVRTRPAQEEPGDMTAIALLLPQLGADELAVLRVAAERLLAGQAEYGRLDLATDPRSWPLEAGQEAIDLAIYLAMGLVAQTGATGARHG